MWMERLLKSREFHSTEELRQFQNVVDQLEFRRDILLAFMEKEGIDPKELDAVAGRGGSLPPVTSGALVKSMMR